MPKCQMTFKMCIKVTVSPDSGVRGFLLSAMLSWRWLSSSWLLLQLPNTISLLVLSSCLASSCWFSLPRPACTWAAVLPRIGLTAAGNWWWRTAGNGGSSLFSWHPSASSTLCKALIKHFLNLSFFKPILWIRTLFFPYPTFKNFWIRPFLNRGSKSDFQNRRVMDFSDQIRMQFSIRTWTPYFLGYSATWTVQSWAWIFFPRLCVIRKGLSGVSIVSHFCIPILLPLVIPSMLQPCWVNLPSSHCNTGDWRGVSRVSVFTPLEGHSWW